MTINHFLNNLLGEIVNLDNDVKKDESGASVDTTLLEEEEEGEEIDDNGGKSKKISFLEASYKNVLS